MSKLKERKTRLINGRLNTYLSDINRKAQEHFEQLIECMKQAQGKRNGYRKKMP